MSVLKNVNSHLVGQLVETERQCSGCKCLEVVEIPTSVKYDALEDKVLNVFWR